MLETTNIISALETAAPIIGGVSTLILAVFYWKQHGKLSEQAEILEEQQKIARFEQTPYLVGPYNMRYDGDSQSLLFELSNSGDGPANHVRTKMELILPGDDWQTEELQLTSSRTDVGFMEPNTIYPSEQQVPFAAEVSDLTIEVEDSDETDEVTEIPLSDYIDDLQDEGTLNIRYVISYSDVFGESVGPFDRDYEIHSPTMGFSSPITLEEHFESISAMNSYKLGQDP